jgi:hypothetical protein
MDDDYLTAAEVAAQLAVPLEMIQRRIESGDIPVHWVEINGKLEMRISSAEIGVEQAQSPPTPFPTPGDLGGEEPQPAGGELASHGWSVRESSYAQDLWTPAESDSAAPAPDTQSGAPWELQSEPEPAAEAEAGPEAESVADLAAAEGSEVGAPVWPPGPVTWELQSEPEPAVEPEAGPEAESVADLAAAEGSEVGAPVWPPGPVTWGLQSQPEPAAEPEAGPEAESVADLAAAEGSDIGVPVWRPEPVTWEDEPLQATSESAVPDEVAAYSPAGTDSFFPLEEESEEATYSVPPPPAVGLFSTASDLEDSEEAAPFAGEEEDTLEVEELVAMDTTLPSEMLGVAEAVDAPRPSALAAAQAADSTLAINSIDARELVAGLFERWERALEQRIQAEQRLRFEAELERRLRQVRDLRQELENTRKATAAQLAEREQEVMALRNRLHEQEAPPKKRGLFRR